MTLALPDPVGDANDIRQIATPYLADLSLITATIATHSLDTIDAVCRDVALCQIEAVATNQQDYITAWHAVQQAASSLRCAIRQLLDETDSNRLAAAVNRTTLSLRAPAST